MKHAVFLKEAAKLADEMTKADKRFHRRFDEIQKKCKHRKSDNFIRPDFACLKLTKDPENYQNDLYYCRLCNCPFLP